MKPFKEYVNEEWDFFTRKIKPRDTDFESDTMVQEEPQEIEVSWTGSYDYNGKRYSLKVGDLTNKGRIIDIIEDIHAYYVTRSGAYSPQELKVIKGDSSEDTNKEEWIEESKKECPYKVGDKVRVIKNYNSVLVNSNNGNRDFPIGSVFTINRVFSDWLGTFLYPFRNHPTYGIHCSAVELVDNEKTPNTEEWVEESVDISRLKVGDLIKTKYISSRNDWNHQICKIESINGGTVGIRRLSDKEYGSTWDMAIFDYYDEPEEQNYEEWLEESKNHEFKLGDKVRVTKIIEKNPEDKKKNEEKYLRKTGELKRIKLEDDVFPYEVYLDKVGSKISFKLGEISLVDDEPEDTNYEEWLEESSKKDMYIDALFKEGVYDSNYKKEEIDAYSKKILETADEDILELLYLTIKGEMTEEEAKKNPNFTKTSRFVTIYFDKMDEYAKSLDEDEDREEWLEEEFNPYTKNYERGDIIQHQTFGRGLVREADKNTMRVKFEDYLRLLHQPIAKMRTTLIKDIRKNDFETSNYEEWVEESNSNVVKEKDGYVYLKSSENWVRNHGFHIGDKVKYIGRSWDEIKTGEIYRIWMFACDHSDELLIRVEGNHNWYKYQRFEKVNDFEDSNFEEWVEE